MPLTHEQDPSRDWNLHVTPWENSFLTRVRNAKKTIRIACPYIKLRNIQLILSSLPDEVDTPLTIEILTRLNLRDCRSYVHDLEALRLLIDNPLADKCSIAVRVDNLLHAKIYIFDDTESIVTSSNLTYAGFNKNREIAIATTVSQAVEETLDHFRLLFRNGVQLEQSAIHKIASKLRIIPKISETTIPEPDSPSLQSEDLASETAETQLDSSPFLSLPDIDIDPVAAEKIEVSLSRHLEEEINAQTIEIDCEAETHDSGNFVERRFYENMQSLYVGLFGGSPPSEMDLAIIYFHNSVPTSTSLLKPDQKLSGNLETIGLTANHAALLQSLIKNATYLETGNSLAVVSSNITNSRFLVRQFSKAGLVRPIVGKSLRETTEADAKGIARISWTVCLRILGYMYRRFEWKVFLSHYLSLSNIAEDFPFQFYETQNYKHRLQVFSQQYYNAIPKYETVEKSGADNNPNFKVAVYTGKKGAKFLAKGTGSSKKTAINNAAKEALEILNKPYTKLNSSYEDSQLPPWFIERCKTEGVRLLQLLTGEIFEWRMVAAVLVSKRTPQDKDLKNLRSRLEPFGGYVRELLSYEWCLKQSDEPDTVRQLVQNINNRSEVFKIIMASPLGTWNEKLSLKNDFQDCNRTGPLVDSFNAIIGAICLEKGIERCSQLMNILFANTSVRVSASLPPRAVLQNKLQSILKTRFADECIFESRAVNKPNEAHNARTEVVIELSGVEIGRAVAGKKTDAANLASQKALENPKLEELLNKYREEEVEI